MVVARLREILEEEFRSELGKSTRFELTEEIGPACSWYGPACSTSSPTHLPRRPVLRQRLDDAPTLSDGALIAE